MSFSSSSLVVRATTWQDRLLVLGSGVWLLAWALGVGQAPGGWVVVARDNQVVHRLPLDREARVEVAGRLGPVAVEVAGGRARLLEYRSARLIGTRTGWIGRRGQVAACVPCGVLLTVEGVEAAGESALPDAVTR